MSTYPTTPTQSAAAAPSKPATLTAAVAVAVIAGLAAVVNGVLILAGGLDLAREVAIKAVARLSGVSVDEVKIAGAALNAGAKEVQDILAGRAYLVLVGGALLLLFGLFMMKGALWARIMVTISALLALGLSVRIVTDDGTAGMLALGWVAVVASLVAIVMAWLPANGRYAKALKKA